MEEGREGRVRIGTSGWVYRHWKGVFYPDDLSAKRWFAHYASHFDTVEVNNSFYRLPSAEAVQGWARQAPPGFVYALKASRFLTHRKKLKDPQEPLDTFLGRARLLGPHLGPVLYQLPPHWHRDTTRLAEFLRLLPADVQHVFEFRDSSWYDDEVRRLLAKAGAGFCMHDLCGSVSPGWLTGRVVYVRFHGPLERAYAGRYAPAQLEPWARRIDDYRRAGHDVYAYFNNDDRGYAVQNALELAALLGGTTLNQGEVVGREEARR